MNLYLRYFDQETLVTNVDDAIGFLKSIPEIEMDAELEADVREYAASDLTYPKRYKVRPRIYFIVIKTTAQTMQDFKDKKALRTPTPAERMENPVVASLAQEAPGWYEGTLDFKRVVMVPATGKFEYRDTHFVANLKKKIEYHAMTFDFLIFFVFIIVFFLLFIVLCALLGYLMLVRVVYA